MTVAIPICQDRVSPLLDVATRLSVIDVVRGTEPQCREVVLLSGPIDQLARSVAELKVNVLICGALSRELEQTLARLGVRVIPRVCGSADEVVRAFLTGQLDKPSFRMPGCWTSCGTAAALEGTPVLQAKGRRHRTRAATVRPQTRFKS